MMHYRQEEIEIMFSRLFLIGLLLWAGGCGGSLSQTKIDTLEDMPLEERIPRIEVLMEKHPEDTRLPGLLGRALWANYESEDPLDRVAIIKRDLRADPENAVLSKLLGDAYYDLVPRIGGTYVDSALFAYENAALKAPDYLSALGSVGALYDEKEDYDQAIHWYEKVLEIDPEHLTTICNLGGSYYNKGEFTTAMNYYRSAMAIDPNSQDAHYNMGVSFAEAGIYREAIKEWRTVVAIDSTTAVGTQAKTNADLLEDVLQSTVYKKGKRSRSLDMPGADVKGGTERRGGNPEESEEK
jgi:tetratricopeptide (TPR) repeat protein